MHLYVYIRGERKRKGHLLEHFCSWVPRERETEKEREKEKSSLSSVHLVPWIRGKVRSNELILCIMASIETDVSIFL